MISGGKRKILFCIRRLSYEDGLRFFEGTRLNWLTQIMLLVDSFIAVLKHRMQNTLLE